MLRIILGAGGHAGVVYAMLQPRLIAGFCAPEGTQPPHATAKILGDDAHIIKSCDPRKTVLYNGIGVAKGTALRKAIFERFTKAGFGFGFAAHNSVINVSDVAADGSQLMAGATLQVGVQLGANVVINTGAIVEHDCHIAAHCFVGPGAILCGKVVLGEGVYVGAGATILPECQVGPGAVIGAGAVVTKNVAKGSTVIGVPAQQR